MSASATPDLLFVNEFGLANHWKLNLGAYAAAFLFGAITDGLADIILGSLLIYLGGVTATAYVGGLPVQHPRPG